MKVAIVHDYLAQYGGAERVVHALHDAWPDAPIYTSIYDRQKMGPDFESMEIHTTWLQTWAKSSKVHKAALPFYPIAFEQLRLSDFDVVVSTSSGFAKGIITPPETLHICYCHTPLRLAWRYHEYVADTGFNPLAKALATSVVNRMRLWDVASSMRVDHFVANSKNTARRIHKFYRRNASVIYPPVDIRRFHINELPESDYYLVVSRLIGYKRVDLAVEAFTRLGIPLKIIGAGPDLGRLKRIAGDNIEFLGRLCDEEVAQYLAGCRGFIFPGEEDFGIAPLEAMASGRPVIAYGRGGALETVVDGVTGTFFDEPRSDSIIKAVRQSEETIYQPSILRRHAERFDLPIFHKQISDLVERKWKLHTTEPSRENGMNRLDDEGDLDPIVVEDNSVNSYAA